MGGGGGMPPAPRQSEEQPGYADGTFPGQAPLGPPGQAPFGTPGQAPFGTPGQAPFGTPGQAPFGTPGQAPFGTIPGPAPSWTPFPGQPAPRRASGFAIASFILGLAGLFIITLVLSVIFGIIALARIRRNPQLRGTGLAITGLILSGLWVVLIVVGIVIGSGNSPQRSSTGQITKKGTTSVFSLLSGDCFRNPTAAEAAGGVLNVTVIPCTQPHNAQVYAEFPATGTSYPGVAALRQQAKQGCRSRIAGNINRSLVTNSMTIQFLYPEAGSWSGGERTIRCLIASPTDVTTSLLVANPAG